MEANYLKRLKSFVNEALFENDVLEVVVFFFSSCICMGPLLLKRFELEILSVEQLTVESYGC